MSSVPTIQLLGQSSVRFTTPSGSLLVDPYLTDSVAEQYGEALRRLHPCPVTFAELSDTRAVLITHAHLDHCDPASVLGILEHAPGARIIAPLSARTILQAAGIASSRLEVAQHAWMPLFDDVRMHAVPAVHPTPDREPNGEWGSIGYVLEIGEQRYYHAGDTSPAQVIVDAVRALAPTIGFIPVNERNYYRERAGIIGNMSVREAFAFAEELGLETLIPVHWELFAPNSTSREEIELVHRTLRSQVALTFEHHLAPRPPQLQASFDTGATPPRRHRS